jgi:3-oxoacyl-[acyl-carrier protein] reductase
MAASPGFGLVAVGDIHYNSLPYCWSGGTEVVLITTAIFANSSEESRVSNDRSNELVQLVDKVIIVTGAGQGIGRATVELAVELGAKVAAVDINKDALDALCAEVGADSVLPLVGDVSNAEFASSAVAETVEKFGAVHGLLNNAGIVRANMLENMTEDQWDQVINVHLKGAFLWTQAVGKHFLARSAEEGYQPGGKHVGAILNVSSAAGRMGTIGQINYGSAKAGMLGMTMSTAREWAKYGIRCNSICFGLVETPMTETVRSEKFRDTVLSKIPMGYFPKPDDVVKSICFLLSDASTYITGQHLGVDGGYCMSA